MALRRTQPHEDGVPRTLLMRSGADLFESGEGVRIGGFQVLVALPVGIVDKESLLPALAVGRQPEVEQRLLSALIPSPDLHDSPSFPARRPGVGEILGLYIQPGAGRASWAGRLRQFSLNPPVPTTHHPPESPKAGP